MFAAASLVPLLIVSHGAYPLAYQMVEKPGDATQLLAGTSFGVVVSHDDGGSWSWICEEAIGYGTGLQPVWYVAPDGTFFGAGFNGLFVSHDQGCTWSAAPEFADAGAADIINTGSTMFAVSQKYGELNGIWRSANQGASWTLTSVNSMSEFYTTVRSAPSRPQRIYVGAWWYMPFSEVLYVSDDNGGTFDRIDLTATLPAVMHSTGMAPMNGAFHVFAVSATDPDVLFGVVWESDGLQPSYVLRSDDMGRTWSLLLTSPDQVSSLALNDDASRIWAGSAQKLYESVDGGTFFTLDTPTRSSCAFRYGDRLYACGWPEVDGFGVGKAMGGSDVFAPSLTWARITGAASCPAGTIVNSTCVAYFPALEATFPPSTLGDGGPHFAEDAGPSDGGCSTSAPCPAPGCHCDGAPMLGVLWGTVVALRTLRRRKKKGTGFISSAEKGAPAEILGE